MNLSIINCLQNNLRWAGVLTEMMENPLLGHITEGNILKSLRLITKLLWSIMTVVLGG